MQDIISKKSIGDRLKLLRKAKQLSQAEASDLLGLSRSHYSQVELGKQFPSYAVLSRVAEVYEKEYEWILHGDYSQPEVPIKKEVSVNGTLQSIPGAPERSTDVVSTNIKEVLLVKSEDFLMYLKFRDQQSFLDGLPKIYLPLQQLSRGPYRAFHVEGDKPEIFFYDQDIVIGEWVDDKLRVVVSRVYVIVLDGDICIRKVTAYDPEGFYECKGSALGDERLEINSILEMWEVKLKITFRLTKGLVPNDTYRKMEQTIRDLTQEVGKIRSAASGA